MKKVITIMFILQSIDTEVRKILYVFSLIIIGCSNTNRTSIIHGSLNDVSSDESRILLKTNEGLSESDIYEKLVLYDININKKHLIAKVSNYSTKNKCFFLTRESILVVSDDNALVYSLKEKQFVDTIIRTREYERIVFSRRIDSEILIGLIDNIKEKILLYECSINSNRLSLVSEYKIRIEPTDNFFDIFQLNKRHYLFVNGGLMLLKSRKEVVSFNDSLGKYIIEQNSFGVCYASEYNGKPQIKLLKDGEILDIQLPVKVNAKNMDISLSKIDNDDFFLLSINDNRYFTIDRNGNCSVIDHKLIFKGKRVQLEEGKENSITIQDIR